MAKDERIINDFIIDCLMCKKAYFLVGIIFINLFSFGQDIKILDKEVMICNQSSNSFKASEITTCNRLTVKDGPDVVSFVFSGNAGGKLFEERINGNSFNEDIVNYIRNKKPNTVYVEVITLADGNLLKPKKLSISYD